MSMTRAKADTAPARSGTPVAPGRQGIARCTVEQLMREHGLNGVTRGRNRTTIPDQGPDDKVNREFTATAPNQFRVSDFTCVST